MMKTGRATKREAGLIKVGSLLSLFRKQAAYQKKVTDIKLPVDNVEWACHHLLALLEEIGEVLKADKRWKTHRNTHYDPENKLEELADCFITLINVCLYSGFNSKQVFNAVSKKINENTIRLYKEKGSLK